MKLLCFETFYKFIKATNIVSKLPFLDIMLYFINKTTFPVFLLLSLSIIKYISISMEAHYLESCIKQFEYYKQLGEKTIEQVPESSLFWHYNQESNSIATIVKHLWGNMLSRWTDFLETDGEKEWRNREAEFDNDINSKEEVLEKWHEGWDCVFKTLKNLKPEDLNKTIYIRHEPHTVIEAINRQLAHYPYHIGQIVFIGKMVCDKSWVSLSIPRGKTTEFNLSQFLKFKKR